MPLSRDECKLARQIEEFFDLATLNIPSDELQGSIQLKSSHIGRENEILQRIHTHATMFFYPLPISFSHDHNAKLDSFKLR